MGRCPNLCRNKVASQSGAGRLVTYLQGRAIRRNPHFVMGAGAARSRGFRGLKRGLGLLDRLRRLFSGGPAKPARGSAGTPVAATQQFGAIPYRTVDGEIVFLMITSRRTRRWIFPKGGLIEGLSPTEIAAEEAFEEAGVRGTMGVRPVEHYRAKKSGPGGGTWLSSEMVPLEVDEQLDDWPEKGERRRQWVTLA